MIPTRLPNIPLGLAVPVLGNSVHVVAHRLLDWCSDNMRSPLKKLYLWIERLKMGPWEARICSDNTRDRGDKLCCRARWHTQAPTAKCFNASQFLNVVDLTY